MLYRTKAKRKGDRTTWQLNLITACSTDQQKTQMIDQSTVCTTTLYGKIEMHRLHQLLIISTIVSLQQPIESQHVVWQEPFCRRVLRVTATSIVGRGTLVG